MTGQDPSLSSSPLPKRGRRYGLWLALFAAGLGVALYWWPTAPWSDPNQRLVDIINAELPRTLDSDTVFKRVTVVGDKLMLEFEMTGVLATQLEPAQFSVLMHEGISAHVCPVASRRDLIDAAARLSYRYTTADGVNLPAFDIELSACNLLAAKPGAPAPVKTVPPPPAEPLPAQAPVTPAPIKLMPPQPAAL